MGLVLLTIVVVGLVMLIMAVGTLFSNRCLRGSCGGPEVVGSDGQPLSCDACPLRQQPRGAADAVRPSGTSA